MVRAAVAPALEDVALWHERDISHSSVERIIAPDATTALGFMLERATRLVQGLVVYPERMRENLERSGGLIFSEAVMLALVEKGLGRQEAYEVVQKNAMAAFAREGAFRELLQNDAVVSAHLSASELAACFDLAHALWWADQLVDRALES
jgi:adenylosuccinate lyase